MKLNFLGCLLFLIALPATAQETLTYRVEYSTGVSGRLHVVIQLPKPGKGPITFVMPRAIPSGYAQQFYDRYVENVRATSGEGKSLRVERADGPRWRILDATVTSVDYEVDLVRLEREITSAADTSKARPGYVGLLGYSVLGYLLGLENVPIRLEVVAPEGWPVFSTLAPKLPTDKTRTTAQAKNFYALADSQIAMGPKVEVRRLEGATPLFFLSYIEVDSDLDKQAQVFAEAFRRVVDYFGEPPFENYTAYVEILKPVSDRHEYGFSMEHLNSSTYFLGIDRAISSTTTQQQLDRDRFNFAHHVSHSWIPKRAYGTGYLPFSWELAPQIETIWFNEGFARYIAIESLADAMAPEEGLRFRQTQLDGLRKTLAEMPEFIRAMPLTELSRIGSLLYSKDFRTGRTLFSKGALMAAELDQKIRAETNGKKRLRDSLRFLVKWSEQSGRPFETDELPGLIAKPVGLSERDVREIIQRWSAGDKIGSTRTTQLNEN